MACNSFEVSTGFMTLECLVRDFVFIQSYFDVSCWVETPGIYAVSLPLVFLLIYNHTYKTSTLTVSPWGKRKIHTPTLRSREDLFIDSREIMSPKCCSVLQIYWGVPLRRNWGPGLRPLGGIIIGHPGFWAPCAAPFLILCILSW